ncbi:Zinc finger BED domain-containing protein 1 [Merluccius polli]|uniref:Zinc finger BED domain-containing protein 1 n=1 Tax=Merluccius polli TaxID=89951 RepID=A0AA47P149_MERPO|nr:Zinc finger BED domain-containing protein 1 [Merluccius polli]
MEKEIKMELLLKPEAVQLPPDSPVDPRGAGAASKRNRRDLKKDPLAWWSQHEEQLPILAHFAKKYLCITASSCASERIFSTSGNICSPRRSRLTEEHLEMLVFLAKNLKTKGLSKK